MARKGMKIEMDERLRDLITKLSYDMNIDEGIVISRSLHLMKHAVNANLAGSILLIRDKTGDETKITVM